MTNTNTQCGREVSASPVMDDRTLQAILLVGYGYTPYRDHYGELQWCRGFGAPLPNPMNLCPHGEGDDCEACRQESEDCA